MEQLRTDLRLLYFGPERRSRMFRLFLLLIDLGLLAFFVLTTFSPLTPALQAADLMCAAVIGLDFLARLWVHDRKLRYFRQASTWADILVIIALLLPALVGNLLFLRVLRLVRLLHAYRAFDDLREMSGFFRRHDDAIEAVINLVVFIFIMSAIVYIFQVNNNPGINNFLDALYFTVSTLTTTGFGDIVMRDASGRILAVAIMVFGVALFIRLARAIIRPDKRRYVCQQCGLDEHDRDAAHCKRCGLEITLASADDPKAGDAPSSKASG